MTTNSNSINNKEVIIDNKQPNDEEAVIVNDPAPNHVDHQNDYEGRKNEPEIDGPQQASQETDEVYADPRKEANLPAGGKNVADLNANDLSQDGNKI